MRSLLGALLPTPSKTPVSFAPRRSMLSLAGTSQSDPVSNMSAMGSVGTLFAIVHRLSNAVAQVDWHLYRKAPSGDPTERTEVTSHAALDLWNRPNRFAANVEFVETFSQHLELTGEAWWIIARNGSSSLPLELWPARPDRMNPVPSPTDFLAGYTYTGPEGETVPLGLNDVIQLRMPNPLDPYRGMGPVQAVLTDIDATKYGAEWNRNFFINSAEPGGIVQVDRRLSDAEFEELRMRWQEQHRGVANAHRVAILEAGKWVERKFSQREMQFTELRTISRDVIREAFGIANFVLGDIRDVNRATADASAAWFAAQMMVPRLERVKYALNFQLLPLYGPAARDLEFDYDNPVTADRETDTMQLTAMAKAASELVLAGYDPAGVLEAVGLPDMDWVGIPAGAPGGGAQPAPAPAIGPATPSRRAVPAAAIAELGPGHSHGPGFEDPFNCAACRPAWLRDAAPDESAEKTRADWEERIDDLLERWQRDVAPGQFEALIAQVHDIVSKGSPSDLAELTVDTTKAADLLTEAMFAQATDGAKRMVAIAASQGVDIAAAVPAELAEAVLVAAGRLVARERKPTLRTVVVAGLAADLAAAAKVTVTNLGKALAAGVARVALHAWAPNSTADDVASQVSDYLDSLTTSTLGTELSAGIWAAENEGRFATLDEAEADGQGATSYTASEVNDKAECDPCAEVDGTEYESLDDAKADYPFGGYRDCEGGNRCRGTILPSWSSQ